LQWFIQLESQTHVEDEFDADDMLIYLFIGEFAIFRVLTHLVPYLQI